MADPANKTQVTSNDVGAFIASVPDAQRREQADVIDAMMRRVTGVAPKMWGPSIIGYGSYAYRYDSGREGTWCRTGFSPRKAAMTIYLIGTYCDNQHEADALFAQLGKHSLGKSCLYIKRLSDIDMGVLERLVALNWAVMNLRYPAVSDA